MGILALVDYNLIKELCGKVQRDNRRFTGKLKIDPEENERTATENKKVDAFKRVLLSDKAKAGKRKKAQKKLNPKSTEKKRFKQSEAAESGSSSSSDSSIGNSSSANESEITDDEEPRTTSATESKRNPE